MASVHRVTSQAKLRKAFADYTIIDFDCLAPVWAGDHWPSDVMGGFLLGLGWSAFVVWLPERWLPNPSWEWISGRRSAWRGRRAA